MLTRLNKVHPAVKHAGYSATTLLPGEDPAAFEKLHQALTDEFTPVGALEEEIIADMARLTWRKQNLATFRIAELAQSVMHKLIARSSRTRIFTFRMTWILLSEKNDPEPQRNKPSKNSGTLMN